MKSFMNIAEVSSALGIEKSTLRLWEKHFPIRVMRGKNSNRRLYRTEELDIIWGIYGLRYVDHYEMAGVKRVFHLHGREFVRKRGYLTRCH